MFSVTKLAGIGLILFGVGGMVSGNMDYQTGIQNLLLGIAVIRGRKAIDKIKGKIF